MNNPILVAETSCTHEFCDESGYVVTQITEEFLKQLDKGQAIVKTLPKETAEICFTDWGFDLVDYPDDSDCEFADIVDGLESSNSDEAGYRIVSNPSYNLSNLAGLDLHRIDLQEISFLCGGGFDGEFRFKCHLKNDETGFVSRMIKIQDIREALNVRQI